MIVDTFWFITTVPCGAEMIFAIRAAARSTSGNQSLHAVIDLVRHSSKNSSRSSLACAGTQPSECEMKCTHSSSAGNFERYSIRLSATGSAMGVAYHGSAHRDAYRSLVINLAMRYALLVVLGLVACKKSTPAPEAKPEPVGSGSAVV